MAISTAIGTDRIGKVVGYEVKKGSFQDVTPNLPMRIAVFGQANTDKQSGLTNIPTEIFSAKEAGEKYGFGSQIHIAMRILRASNGDVTGGIPTIAYPQLAPAGGTARVEGILVSGLATGNAVHKVFINGRSNFDGSSLEVSIIEGDNPTMVAQKITDVVNAAQSCPVSGAPNGVDTNQADLTVKWAGESGEEISVIIDTGGNPAGLSYAIAPFELETGDSSAEISSSLDLFAEKWNTIVISPYLQTRNHLFETANGIPGEGTGRNGGEVFKPFVCLVGSKVGDSVANIIAGLNKDQATIVRCPAPNSNGWNVEAAANCAALLARQAQDSPHLDISGKFYSDMPIPMDEDAGVFKAYNTRDAIVKGGSSTVVISNGRYLIEDFITTYHPDNELPPQFRYVRSLIQDWNVRFSYFLLERIHVVDHAIADDSAPVIVTGIIKIKQWRSILDGFFTDLNSRMIIVESQFSVNSLTVGTSATNPDRLETFFRYKRSPYARIASTTAEAGFAFGLS